MLLSAIMILTTVPAMAFVEGETVTVTPDKTEALIYGYTEAESITLTAAATGFVPSTHQWIEVGKDSEKEISGETSATYKVPVDPKSIAGATVTLDPAADLTYNGQEQEPAVNKVTLQDGVTELQSADYDVAYSNNTNAGTATVTGKGNYTGSATANFDIKKLTVTGLEATVTSTAVYNGEAQTVTVTDVKANPGAVALKEGEYEVAYAKNSEPDTPIKADAIKDADSHDVNITSVPGNNIAGEVKVTKTFEITQATVTGKPALKHNDVNTDGKINAGDKVSVDTTGVTPKDETVTVAYQWKVAGSNVGTDESSYTIAAGDVDDVTCDVTFFKQ